MFLCFKRFKLIDWDEKTVSLTAKQLLERTKQNNKKGYCWFAPISEIVKICDNPDFPEKYAKEIKLIILNAFAKLETKHEIMFRQKAGDQDAVHSCYNSLNNNDPRVVAAKEQYLRAILEGITKYHFTPIEFISYSQTYRKLCEEWKEEQFKKYFLQDTIDFLFFKHTLNESFEHVMQKAENDGLFKAENEQRFESIPAYLSKLNLKEF